MMTPKELEACRRRLINGLRRIVRKCSDVIGQQQWWNENRPEEKPIPADDIAWALALKPAAERALRAVVNYEEISQMDSDIIDRAVHESIDRLTTGQGATNEDRD